MTDVIEATQKFPKLFWAMFRNPDIPLAKYLNSPSSRRLLPGAFLFINLLLAEILEALWMSTSVDKNGWASIALKESYQHIAGTLLLLLLLKFAFWQVRPFKLFSILCLSSVVFISDSA